MTIENEIETALKSGLLDFEEAKEVFELYNERNSLLKVSHPDTQKEANKIDKQILEKLT